MEKLTKEKLLNTRKSSVKKSGTGKIIQRVLPLGNGWMVKSDRSKTFTVITISQREAISIARSLARHQHSDLIIHNKKGEIKAKFSYALQEPAKRTRRYA